MTARLHPVSERRGLHYGCHHASCNGKGWQDVKHLLKLPKKPRLTVNGKEPVAAASTAELRAVGLKLRKASEIDPPRN